MGDPNSVRVLWDIHGMKADVLKEGNTFTRLSRCSVFVQCIEKTEWYLCFYIYFDELRISLFRKSGQESERIELEYDIHLLTYDGSIWRKSEKRKKMLRNQEADHLTLASRQDFLDNSNVLIDNGIVRLSANLRPVGYSLPRHLTFCVSSRAGVSRKVFLNVEQMSRILKGEERDYTLENIVSENVDNKLILFLREGKICMRVEHSSDRMYVVLCESARIIQSEDTLQPWLQCWEGCKLLRSDDCNCYLDFIEAERLTTDLGIYVKSDELKIFFQLTDFSTYSLVSVSEVIEGNIRSIEMPKNEVSSASPTSAALQTQSRGVSTDDSLERGHPDCPIGSDFKSLLLNGTFSDFKLKVGLGSISVHKAVLCARSPVLKAMLESSMRESLKNEMDVPDFHPDTVIRLVCFLYSGCLPDLDQSNVPELYEAADKYGVSALRALCSRAIVSGLGVSNVCDVLSFSDRHQDAELKEKAMDFIQMHKSEVLLSQEWIAFMKDELPLAVEVLYYFEVQKCTA